MKQLFLVFSLLLSLLKGFSQCETFHANITTTPPTCFEMEDGIISVTAVGGASPYSINIYNAGGYLLNPFGATTLFTLTDGWYYVNAEDAIGCFTADSVFIENLPHSPLLIQQPTPPPMIYARVQF